MVSFHLVRMGAWRKIKGALFREKVGSQLLRASALPAKGDSDLGIKIRNKKGVGVELLVMFTCRAVDFFFVIFEIASFFSLSPPLIPLPDLM